MENVFDSTRCDLGTSGYGMGIADIDNMLKHSAYPESTPCLVCGQAAKYKLVPKKASCNTAEIQDKGFICEYCLQSKAISSKDYGIRDM
jgi:hypothetical protein